MSSTAARRGPRKVRLDADLIIAAGLEVAREERSSTFSAKLLGQKLGVDPSAVYRHFRNKDELMSAFLDALYQRAVDRVTADPEDWRERLIQLAEMMLHEFVEHPSIAVEAMTITTHRDGEYAFIECILDALTRAGFSPEQVVRSYALVSSHILSMASGIALDRTGYNDEDRAANPVDEADPESGMPWLFGPILADARNTPNIARYAPMLAELKDRDIYLLGLTSLIDAAEQAAVRS